jgi:hypothetical protein
VIDEIALFICDLESDVYDVDHLTQLVEEQFRIFTTPLFWKSILQRVEEFVRSRVDVYLI